MGKVQELLKRGHEATKYRPHENKIGGYEDNYHCRRCKVNTFRIDHDCSSQHLGA